MTLDQLRYFQAAAHYQHVGKAARACAISPSAISTAIAVLQEELGCRLFERVGKNIALTPRGRALVDQAQQVFDRVAALRHVVAEGPAGLEGTFRLGASHFLAARLLAPAWAALTRESPALRGELCALPTAQVINEVALGRLDFGLCFSPFRHPDLTEDVLYRGELRLTVGRHHPLARAKGSGWLKSLSSYPAVLHKAGPGVDLCETHPMFEAFGVRPDLHVLFDSDDCAAHVLQTGPGWSLLPDLVLAAFADRLRALPKPKGWQAPYTVALIARHHRAASPVRQALRRILTKALAARARGKGPSPGRLE